MSTHASNSSTEERLELRGHGAGIYILSGTVAAVGLVFAVLLGYLKRDDFQQFFFSYLTAYSFFFMLCLGGLFLVLLQHCTRAGWSVNVRRIGEWFAAQIPIIGILGVPILASVLRGDGKLYPWANKDALHHLNAFKRVYFLPGFFIGRYVFFFAIWSIMGNWFFRGSVKQDQTGDEKLTRRMQSAAPLCMVVYAITFTLAVFDLLMSLDPDWASTIFGVYCYAGSTLTILAAVILIVMFLQARGYMLESVTTEHFHDLGKFLFGFTFFYGYIAYSQYMLMWYANTPEETHWWLQHGATTSRGASTPWTWVCLVILFGRILIPFAGLLSRHVKRNRNSLAFWAVWVLVMEWVDIYWMVMAEYKGDQIPISLIDLAALLGIGGLVVAMTIRLASRHAIRPMHDPRLADSLAFENV